MRRFKTEKSVKATLVDKNKGKLLSDLKNETHKQYILTLKSTIKDHINQKKLEHFELKIIS